MNDAPMHSDPAFSAEGARHRQAPATKVTLDFSGIPAKAQQAISAWLSETDQQAIVDALAAMARKVDSELLASTPDEASGDAACASEIVVTPSINADFFRQRSEAEPLKTVA